MTLGSDDDLRGSIPVYSAKDILQKLDRKVDEMDTKLDTAATAMTVLMSQNLNDRLTKTEAWQQRINGLAILGPVLGAIALAWQLIQNFRVIGT